MNRLVAASLVAPTLLVGSGIFAGLTAADASCENAVIDDSAPVFGQYLTPEERRRCPGPVSASSKDGLYEFTYEWWVRLGRPFARYIFGRCVENLTEKPVYINWSGLCCHANANDSMKRYQSSEDTDCVEIDDKLMYGPRPDKIDTNYRWR